MGTIYNASVLMTAMDKNILFQILLDGYVTIFKYKVKHIHIYYTLINNNGTFRIFCFHFDMYRTLKK